MHRFSGQKDSFPPKTHANARLHGKGIATCHKELAKVMPSPLWIPPCCIDRRLLDISSSLF
jgi:hypothetical protein